MTTERLQTHLADVETLLDDMATLLVRGDAPAYEHAATALRQCMAELAHASAEEPPSTLREPTVRHRLQQVAYALARQRDNLARCAVVSDRGLAAVLPQHEVTYAAPGRGGMFKGSTARIYMTPAA